MCKYSSNASTNKGGDDAVGLACWISVRLPAGWPARPRETPFHWRSSSVREVVLPFLLQQPSSVPLRNLWMTLETGQASLKTDSGSRVIVWRLSHPSARRRAAPHTRRLRQLVAGNVHVSTTARRICGKSQGGTAWKWAAAADASTVCQLSGATQRNDWFPARFTSQWQWLYLSHTGDICIATAA